MGDLFGLASSSSNSNSALSKYSPDALKGILGDSSYSPAQLESFAGGLGTDMAGLNKAAGLSGGSTDWFGASGVMGGLTGIGQLGLGLANYFQNKPILEEQLKSLKQYNAITAENQQNRKNIASDLA